MSKEASNGQRKYWFIIPAITIVSLIVGFTAASTRVKDGVQTNAAKNAAQDMCIDRNQQDIHRLDTAQARIDERLAAIQADVRRILERGSGG